MSQNVTATAVAGGVPAVTPVSKTGNGKSKRVRKTIGALRIELAAQGETIRWYRENNERIQTTANETSNRILVVARELDAKRRDLQNARMALELVLSMLALSTSPVALVKLIEESAEQFGFRLIDFNGEVQQAMADAYTNAPARAVELAVQRADNARRRPATGEDALLAMLAQIGARGEDIDGIGG